MKILVTGATGFLGTALCERLRATGAQVTALGSRDADLTRQGSLERFAEDRYQQIWHLAAWTQAGDFCLRHPGEQWIRNQQINTEALRFWAERQPQAKLIAMGTSCAYSPDVALSEENYLLGEPIDSLYTYAMTKRMLYVGQKSLAKQYGLKYLCLVPSTLYGPGYHSDDRQMHFIFDLMRKILRAELYGDQVVLWGDGHQSRELVHVDDFAGAAIRLAAEADNELINIGAGREYTIRHFAQLICEAVGYDFELIQFDTSRYTGAKSKCLKTEKLAQILPDFRRTDLAVGLRQTIDWMRAQQSLLSRAA